MYNATRATLLKLSCGAALALGASLAAQAAVLKENFNAAFPAWESGWFAANSDAINHCTVNYCLVDGEPTAPGPAVRGDSGSGMWLSSENGYSSSPITITFEPTFGASLKALKLDVSAYVQSTLQAWDMKGNLIFSRKLKVNIYTDIPTSQYQKVLIRSSKGIASFSFSGYADGNTVIDNVVALTRAAPATGTEDAAGE